MDARPSGRIKKIISKLAGDPHIRITIVSGRKISSLIELFENFDIAAINWSGAHGIQMRFENSSVIRFGKALPEMLDIKKEISGMISPYPCYQLEDKKVSFALHYRKCPDRALHLLVPIKRLLNKYTQNKSIEVLHMKKVIEVKPAGVNKGNTLEAVNARYSDFENFVNICIGDDVTDEYLFLANPGGINIKVGKDKNVDTAAGYYLKGVSDVYWLLNKIHLRSRGS